ncbi:DUF262 domain-containing protein [Macrococcoides caseolyticum]|uniref:DUF262 domain-containing protein n=1 Tax=Macrococcoides caseolyticum TaxID=69966 RepID=A0A855GHM0_9STAP|nr:DUF262 domain-containing protein [Macrococcus caseolyticus]PKE26841.1 DUF262 domain-containing protein [Macrococcus caseolyticus]PKE59475.1 DUF262 domain-containing protein [Macrococcus caseolyticus]PKE66141.1 DUF262 domain-containing protein [Macrococcus caseolyticus]PKE69983.1 DUF262 domain-containing protein [Macrococcus caseolyticus]UTH04350.1 DUF262 domain-containing protein [Macrococcus caseolyticus]
MTNNKQSISGNTNKNIFTKSASEIFKNMRFLIPIYQRNYAWVETQIVQLIEDIDSAVTLDTDIGEYFLGNLILNKRDTLSDEGYLYTNEVIDGQQRLTTLYILCSYLGITFDKEALRFEARVQSNQTLDLINEANVNNDGSILSEEILKGYEIIKNYFLVHKIDKEDFKTKLTKVKLVVIYVPQDIDLNHYFEIMNTRGEQLELHEIAKARILEQITSSDDQPLAATIWDACSNMNRYVQMNFSSDFREEIFNDNWDNLKENLKCFGDLSTNNNSGNHNKQMKLIDIIKGKGDTEENTGNTVSENDGERFDSIISFPNFLLQVNAALSKENDETPSLDDKHLLQSLAWVWQKNDDESDVDRETRAKDFLFQLLKTRIIFDRMIIKREYEGKTLNEGRWSLQRVQRYGKRRNYTADYVHMLKESENKQLKVLQSALRVTYVSPKAMRWITLVLKNLLNENKEESDIIQLLEDYCRESVRKSDYKNKRGFQIEHIVFNYLDYLLYRDGYEDEQKQVITKLSNWEFQFRNSIEHFYPQHPLNGDLWDEHGELNSFGNLALISVSGNSKFSNRIPEEKAKVEHIVNQSLKLEIMAHITKKSGWSKEKVKCHCDEMIAIIDNDIRKADS